MNANVAPDQLDVQIGSVLLTCLPDDLYKGTKYQSCVYSLFRFPRLA